MDFIDVGKTHGGVWGVLCDVSKSAPELTSLETKNRPHTSVHVVVACV